MHMASGGTKDGMIHAFHTHSYHSRWFRQRHTFIGMLDADEFVVLRDVPKGHKPDLRSFLKPFEQHGGIVVSNMGGLW